MSTNKLTNVTGLWDLQYPHHEPDVVDIFFQISADYRPKVVILGGDNLDCTPVASHGPSAKTRVEQPIDLDFSGIDKNIVQRIEREIKPERKIWMRGNHEMWLDDYRANHPETGDLVDEVKELHLKERGWEIVPYKKYTRVGKIFYHHGDWRQTRRHAFGGSKKYHAYDAVVRTHRNIRYGHNHTLQVHSLVNPLDSNDAHTGMCIPAACKLDQHYLEGGETNWLNGLYIAHILPNGNFSDFALIVSHGATIYGGKVYKASRGKV